MGPPLKSIPYVECAHYSKTYSVARVNSFSQPLKTSLRFLLSHQEFPLHGQSVNDLVAVVPGVELLFLRVVFQTGVGPVPPGKVDQGGLLAADHVVDVEKALDPGPAGRARVVDYVDGPADHEGRLRVLPRAPGVPGLLDVERGQLHPRQVDVRLSVTGRVQQPEALVVRRQVSHGFRVEAVDSGPTLRGEHGDVGHRAAQQVIPDHLHVCVVLLLYVVQVAAKDSAAGTSPIGGKSDLSAAGDAG